VLFGDGAGAVVLAADAKPGLHASVLRADGSHAGILCVPGNISGGRIVGSPFLQMQGSQVFKFAVKVLDEVARETVAAAGMRLEDVDWLIPHQANVRILEATARRLGLPMERLVVTVDHHGNTSAASVPLALDEFVRAGKIRAGHRVLMQGVGGGFTWGATLATM
jgi:3-oxoacyl-[acyl-carrier-protein] synthase-3